MVAVKAWMESCDEGDGGVAVRTREMVPPEEQLEMQPPPGTPLQDASIRAVTSSKAKEERWRMV